MTVHVINAQTRAERWARRKESMFTLKEEMENGIFHDETLKPVGSSYENVRLILMIRDRKPLVHCGVPESREEFLQKAEKYRLEHGLKSVYELTEADIPNQHVSG